MDTEIYIKIPGFIGGDDVIHDQSKAINKFLAVSAGILGEKQSEQLKQTVRGRVNAQPILEDRDDVSSWLGRLTSAMRDVVSDEVLQEKQAALEHQLSKSSPKPIHIMLGVFSAVLLIGVALGVTGLFFSLPLMFVGIGVGCLGGGGALVSFAMSRSSGFRGRELQRDWDQTPEKMQVFESLEILKAYCQVMGIGEQPSLSSVRSDALSQSPIVLNLQNLSSVSEEKSPHAKHTPKHNG